MTERWKCTSYCLCGSRKGHFEKSDDGVWVLHQSHTAEVERLRAVLRTVHEECASSGCEGSDDIACIESQRAIEDWCPWCRISQALTALNGEHLRHAVQSTSGAATK